MKDLWIKFKERALRSWTMIWAGLLLLGGAVVDFAPLFLDALNVPEVAEALRSALPGSASLYTIGVITVVARLRSLLKG